MLTVDINQKEKKGISFVLDYLNDKKITMKLKRLLRRRFKTKFKMLKVQDVL